MRQTRQRRKKNSARMNLAISLFFHGLIFFLLGFWAAHEGVLGAKLKELTVALVPKEKPPEPAPPPKIEPPKDEAPKTIEPVAPVAAAPPVVQSAPPPATGNGPVATAPAAASPADFAFGDGARPVEVSADAPTAYYKNLVEYSLRAHWDRPVDILDDAFVAEVEVMVDAQGRITGFEWKKGSGNQRWDDTVRKALASTKSLTRPPPKGFPEKFLVRFDVQPATDPIL